MGGFLSFVKKEALHIVRDPRTMLIVLLMPVVQVLLFGFAMNTEVTDIEVAVVAPHPTEAVRRAVERIAANPYFTFRGCIAATEIDRTLRRGDADASNTNTASAGAGYLTSVLLSGAPGVSAAGTRLLFNPQMKSSYNFVPGIMGMIFILICAMMTSVSIVREKETGTMEVLLVSPVRPLKVVLAKMIPYFALSCFNLASILLLARFVLDVPLSGNLGAIIGVSMLYLALSLAFGLLISTFADRQATALIISGMLILLPIIMFSGLAFPIENMPKVLQPISCIIPTRWYIDAVRKLMIEGLPFGGVLREFSILAAMTALLIAAALRKFNDKLE